MAKKPLTTFDKVCKCLEGTSNEDAEDIAVKILSQVAAKRIYIEKIESFKVLHGILKKIAEETNEYRKNNSFMLALGRVYLERHSATNSPQTPE